MQEVWGKALGGEGALEMVMATWSSSLAWESPRTEDPGGAAVHGVAENQTWPSN